MPSIIGARGNRRRIGQIKQSSSIKPSPKTSKHGYGLRNENLKTLGFESYSHYLKSNLWAIVRQLAYRKHGRICFICGCVATQLHHSSYDLPTLSGSNLSHIHPICCKCHKFAEFDEFGKAQFNEANQALGIETPDPNTSEYQKLLDTKDKKRREEAPGVGLTIQHGETEGVWFT